MQVSYFHWSQCCSWLLGIAVMNTSHFIPIVLPCSKLRKTCDVQEGLSLNVTFEQIIQKLNLDFYD